MRYRQVDQKTHPPGKILSAKELDALPLFFIVGRGRSGSTLLRSVLDAHPAIMIPLESRFVQFLYYNFPRKGPWTMETALRALDALDAWYESPDLHGQPLLDAIHACGPELTFHRFCKLIYLHSPSAFEKGQVRILGDKNPRYSFFIPQLMQLFPGARFIHLVRDFRDNLLSVQGASGNIKESGNPYVAMGRWCLYNRVILKHQKRHPGVFHRVHFEELIREPGKVMQELCAFLGVDYDPDMLHYRDGLEGNFKDPGFSALHQSLQNPFDPSKIGAWKGVLPQRTIIRCEVLGGHLPEALVYPPGQDVSAFRRFMIHLFYYPLFLLGQSRFLVKNLFYRSRSVMRMAYGILMKTK